MLRNSATEGILVSLSLLIIIICVLSVVSLLPTQSKIEEGQQYLVLFPPGSSATENFTKIASAGGTPVRNGRFDFIVIATFNTETSFQNLHKHGALFIGDTAIKGGCSFSNKNKFLVI